VAATGGGAGIGVATTVWKALAAFWGTASARRTS
jgi:hypothetical protein